MARSNTRDFNGQDRKGNDMDVSIEIAVVCSMFQRRLCWMMSSVLQQKGDVPKLVFNVAYPKDEGSPRTEEVCTMFKNKGLAVREVVLKDRSEFEQRGLIRNRQLELVDSDFVLFADADMVYDPYFFEDLGKQALESLKDDDKCVSARRYSLTPEHCCQFFNEKDIEPYPRIIDNVADLVSKWPKRRRMSRSCGAGYFQMINVAKFRSKFGNVYIPTNQAKDRSLSHVFKSDRQFRLMLGGITRIESKPQYHLNHERGLEVPRQW